MPVGSMRMSDLEVAVRVLRMRADGATDAFGSAATASGSKRTNVVEAFDRVEAHFGVHLIERIGSKERRAGGVTPAGLLVMKQGAGILWLHAELVNDLAAARPLG